MPNIPAAFSVALVVSLPTLFYMCVDRKHWSFLNPMNSFWAGYVVYGVIVPTVDMDFWLHWYGEEMFVKTMVMYALSGAAVWLGYFTAGRRRTTRRFSIIGTADNPAKLLRVGVAIV